MNIAINNNYFKNIYNSSDKLSDYESIKVVKNAGFNHIDFDPLELICSENYQKEANILAEKIKELGVCVEQTHAPFNRYNKEPVDFFVPKLQKSLEASAIIGAKRMVIHADEYIAPDGKYNGKDAFKFAYDFFSPIVERAKKLGIGIAIENLFEDGGDCLNRTRYTSAIEELLEIIDSFSDPIVTCCWDFGHAAVAFKDEMLDKLKLVGNRLSSTHVHDNNFWSDSHSMPFLGKIDWESNMKYLQESGYKGAFTFEFVYGNQPKPILDRFLETALITAEYLTNIK